MEFSGVPEIHRPPLKSSIFNIILKVFCILSICAHPFSTNDFCSFEHPPFSSGFIRFFLHFGGLCIFIFAMLILYHFLTPHFCYVLQRFRRNSSYIGFHFWIQPDFLYGKSRKHNVFAHFQICSKTLQNSFAQNITFPMGFRLFSAFCGSHLQELMFDFLIMGFCSGRPPGRPSNLILYLMGDY